jgi:hypothetical protein
VLYNDECFFRVYDGESGDVLMERPNSHRTATEYPIVVDVDGDSNSEILVASTGDQAINRDCCAGTSNCTTSSRAAYPGAKAYYRSPADLYVLASYDPAFCTCRHLTGVDACAIESGCTWDGSTGECMVYDCNQHGTSGACDGAARHCQWVGGNCVPYPDTPDQICRRGTWGVWAFGDEQDLWVKTRPQWNQHTFHVTDATLEGEPVADWGPGENNWEVFNNYRQNVQGFAPLNAPDLQVFSLTANLLGCPLQITLNVRVVNRGRAGILAGVPIAFYEDAGGTPVLLGTVPLPYALLPGQGADVSFILAVTPGAPPIDVSVIVNPPDGASPSFECRADNNEATLFGVECPGIGG